MARPKGIWTEKRLIVVCLYRTSPEIGQSYVENAHLKSQRSILLLAFVQVSPLEARRKGNLDLFHIGWNIDRKGPRFLIHRVGLDLGWTRSPLVLEWWYF